VLASGQEPEHTEGILRVARLAEDRLIEHHEGVRAEDPSLRVARGDPAGFGFRQARSGPGRVLSGSQGLVDVGGLDLEGNAETREDFRSSG